ncbi:uncharacterized protein CMU_015070 [Cryptosporidium muris RN66]|uniref:Uncharacterized protein n=1 Tax=Cryptosporidium muris (strain RN66) TaxID=441375 RepID=B6AF64_CRYMR|nr:uncharacterized protein CMU_015070 [Cryptosporidium muris RN66]EEA06831.1 hypothetical protein CMU_015070 [Cryptosporidium muris RN66]|eukprot:XP_002141180.1 hypothetical protein [Cryptosporidium muris RN66]
MIMQKIILWFLLFNVIVGLVESKYDQNEKYKSSNRCSKHNRSVRDSTYKNDTKCSRSKELKVSEDNEKRILGSEELKYNSNIFEASNIDSFKYPNRDYKFKIGANSEYIRSITSLYTIEDDIHFENGEFTDYSIDFDLVYPEHAGAVHKITVAKDLLSISLQKTPNKLENSTDISGYNSSNQQDIQDRLSENLTKLQEFSKFHPIKQDKSRNILRSNGYLENSSISELNQLPGETEVPIILKKKKRSQLIEIDNIPTKILQVSNYTEDLMKSQIVESNHSSEISGRFEYPIKYKTLNEVQEFIPNIHYNKSDLLDHNNGSESSKPKSPYIMSLATSSVLILITALALVSILAIYSFQH